MITGGSLGHAPGVLIALTIMSVKSTDPVFSLNFSHAVSNGASPFHTGSSCGRFIDRASEYLASDTPLASFSIRPSSRSAVLPWFSRHWGGMPLSSHSFESGITSAIGALPIARRASECNVETFSGGTDTAPASSCAALRENEVSTICSGS